jgi:hypothetical protein
MDDASGHNPVARAIGGLIVVFTIAGLYFQLTEPFRGLPLGYVGRLLGPVVTLFIGAHLLLQRRPRPLIASLVLVLSVLASLFVVLGLRHAAP